MPDFMMCDAVLDNGKECPQKDRCERFLNMPDQNQSWFAHAPYDQRKKSCGFFKAFQEMRKD